MLQRTNTVLLLIDIQGNLAHAMPDKEDLFRNVQTLLQGGQMLDIPVLWVEQNPRGLGPTIPEIAASLPGLQAISKMSFSSCRNEHFMQALTALDRKQILITGIEAHICVYQTAVELMAAGYEVQLVTDAVAYRNPQNKTIGLQRMKDAGASWTSVETALFELLGTAEDERFRAILKLVK